jgi:hypothetical protein
MTIVTVTVHSQRAVQGSFRSFGVLKGAVSARVHAPAEHL